MLATRTAILVAAAAVLLAGRSAAPADEALDRAFESLKTYDWGQDRGSLLAIDRAVVASRGESEAARDLERRLAELLKAAPPQAAQIYICRQLSLVGSAQSVPALAERLRDPQLSHMACYALERIADPAAAAALRAALPETSGSVRVGVINSLAARRDADSTAGLISALGDTDPQVAAAAAAALGAIGSPATAQALREFQKNASPDLQPAAADACLRCAERLLAEGEKAEAAAIYRSLASADQPRHIRLAATRGLLGLQQK